VKEKTRIDKNNLFVFAAFYSL